MVECENFPLNIYFLRNSDIPRYLSDGVVDLAIIGQNLKPPGVLDIISSPDIYFPLGAFFILIITTIFLRKIFYKK